MSYTPPSHNAVQFTAGAGPYSPPAWNGAKFAAVAQVAAPDWWVSLELGVPTVTQQAVLAATSWDSVVIGAESAIRLQNRPVYPSGIASLAIGEPSVRWSRQVLAPVGVDATWYGALTIEFLDRSRALVGFDAATYGAANLESTIRYLYPPGFDAAGYGAFNFPVWLSGFAATRFGWLDIRDATQTVVPYSKRMTEWGEPRLSRSPIPCPLRGFLSANEWVRPNERWGLPEIRDKAGRPRLSGFEATEFGPRPGVANRNRTIALGGYSATKISAGLTVDKGPVIEWRRFPSTQYGSALVAHRIRSVDAEGIEPPPIDRWNAVRNRRKVIATVGRDLAAYGVLRLTNTRRYYPNVGVGEQLQIGVPMIGPRLRALALGRMEDGLEVPEPVVTHGRRALVLSGFEATETGRYFLQSVINRLIPRWNEPSSQFGAARLRNVTPEVRLESVYDLAFGRLRVQINWLRMWGNLYAEYGRSTVGYRNRSMRLAPISAPVLGVGHRIDLTQFVPQRVYSFIGLRTEIGAVTVRPNQIELSGFEAGEEGSAVVTRMGVSEVGFPSVATEFGTIQFSPIYLRLPTTVDNAPPPSTEWGVPSLSLQSFQAPSIDWLEVGSVAVTHRDRQITPAAWDFSAIPNPMVALRRRRVYPTPLKSLRFGIAYLRRPGVLAGFDSFVAGEEIEVTHTPVRTDPVLVGTDMAEYGATTVELQNRPLPLQGAEMQQFGVTWVSPPPRPVLTGDDLAEYGTGMVSHRIRTLSPEGADFLRCGRTRLLRGQPLFLWGSHMLDWGKPHVAGRVQTAGLRGFESQRMGRPRMSSAKQVIRPLPLFKDRYQYGYPVVTRG